MSTLKQYASSIKQWKDFCDKNELDFLDIKVENVLKFLTERFQAGAAYGTLNSCRSAVSLLSEEKIGEHPNVTRFMRGAFKCRPAQPKYNITWDVSTVLDYIENMDTSTLELLTIKTVTLLAICSAQRAQTLSKIKINNIQETPDGLVIKVDDLIKTSGPDRYQPALELPRYPEKPKICVVDAILSYLSRTQPLRKNNCNELFIAIKKPHEAVTSQTISKWVKKCLGKSGIDISIFTSHSTRHAATSAAYKKGLDFDCIRRTAGWTERSQVFAKFYKRPIVHSGRDFAKAVLS